MNNSEILFVYDAKMCNPNGDPDEENRPRMDYDRQRNLVSDVRLKRYIRDYLEENGYEIYVTRIDDRAVTAGERLKALLGHDATNEDIDEILTKLIDVRMFGATMPIKGERRGAGASLSLTGPVQFNWGYSINKVDLVESNGITSHFASEQGSGQGTMGKDYRVYYSLIAFHGIVSGKRVRETNLTDEDVSLLDKALIKSIPLQATRSKIGQYPRLYMRVEYTSDEDFIGDLRNYISLDRYESLREPSDFAMDLSRLKDILVSNNNIISKINLWYSGEMRFTAKGKEAPVEDLLGEELKDKINILEY
ncbi:type I-B CRISPR-associated protein Cas7/Csh2 [Calorimonas adulescens]|uniref:Type I-B CRISPR-associated protein Cas7/Csh2 n=1 Tax=Calorimonas adulescens TaxID=2606906 RepID=A0A5D8QE91_9THEO|nr:type I-B CRISPR-associated protein Cas7/Csh2 [Calorimonas adulescens]TZE82822.1 type I-B CRISPR-associated protein Cas7/Csh2 [Calorimonas adulescens]